MLKNEFVDILKGYFPIKAILPISELLNKYPVRIHFTLPRKTKKGSFVFTPRKPLKITLNNNLQPEEMLLVFLHEMAHYVAFRQYGQRIKPHGKEWQLIFLSLINQFIDNGGFSDAAAKVLRTCYLLPAPRYRPNCRILHEYFYPPLEGKIYLYQLVENDRFSIAKSPDKKFILVKKRRTQYLCKNLVNGKLYLIHYFVEINRLYE